MERANKYFIYARKSTDVEDKQVRSIDAQLAELRELAQRESILVLEELVEKESAKMPGKRRVFNAMLDRIEAGDANGIISWHPDRLARNMTDGGRVIDLIDTGKLAALKFPTFWFESTPQGKFMLGMAFSQSKYYVDSLAQNTRRGLREKVKRGEYPSQAPIGYLNDHRVKRIKIDSERAPIVKRMFERYATETESVDSIRDLLAEYGVRSRDGKVVGSYFVTHLLTNPIYYGHFRYAGDIHEGNHEPIITKSLFDQVQAVFAKRFKYSPKAGLGRPKPFIGLLRCAECGCAVTGEIQKGHTYYHCTKKNRAKPCGQPYVREEALDAQLSALLSPYSLRKDWADEMLSRIETEKKNLAGDSASLVAIKREQIEQLNLKVKQLVDMRLDGEIDAKTHLDRKAKIMSQRKTLEEQIAGISEGRPLWLEPFREWVWEAKEGDRIAKTGALTERKTLAKKIFGSNLVLSQKKARGRAVNPWAIFADNELSHDVERVYAAARTHFQGQPSPQDERTRRIDRISAPAGSRTSDSRPPHALPHGGDTPGSN